jgi:hypothetical protein
VDTLAATLTYLAERMKEPDWSSAELLHEFPAGNVPGVLACIHFALRDRPGTLILTAPVRPARMH